MKIRNYMNEAFGKVGPRLSYKEMIAKSKEYTDTDPEMDKRLIKAANNTWQYIGGDIMDATAEDGRDYVSQAEVIEVVTDADYMFEDGGDHEAYAYFRYLADNNRPYLDKLMKKAFPYKRYS